MPTEGAVIVTIMTGPRSSHYNSEMCQTTQPSAQGGGAAHRSNRTRSCTDREPPELSDCSAFWPNPPSGVLEPLVWLSSLRPEAYRQSSVSDT